eukprot:scaffold3108_cov102-Skeletonema_dohrnii-CCMP3373.AAC.3
MKLVPSFALHLSFVLFGAIPGIGALSDAEMKRLGLDLVKISSPKKKTSSISSHLPNFRHESVVNIIHVLSDNRGRRLRPDDVVGVSAKSAKTTSKSAKASSSSSSSSCQAKLDTCQAAAAAPKWLFVQMADMCTLYRNVDGEYHIESSKFHKITEWFTDRPFQFEATQPTSEWFKNFMELFDDEKEGYIKDTETEGEGGGEGQTYGYKLEQSTSQESVMSLEALMDGEDSEVEMTVTVMMMGSSLIIGLIESLSRARV